jgi:hypothetical protein
LPPRDFAKRPINLLGRANIEVAYGTRKKYCITHFVTGIAVFAEQALPPVKPFFGSTASNLMEVRLPQIGSE